MKTNFKFLITIFALANSISAIANDGKSMSVIWPYSVSDPPANYTRFAIDEMNKAQSQYNFIFENKPGAGSAIAARHEIGRAHV